MQRDRSMAVDVIAEFLHTGGPPLNADDAAVAIVDVLEREGFNLDRVRDARGDDETHDRLVAGLFHDLTNLGRERDHLKAEVERLSRSPQGEDHETARPEQPPPDTLGGQPPAEPPEAP